MVFPSITFLNDSSCGIAALLHAARSTYFWQFGLLNGLPSPGCVVWPFAEENRHVCNGEALSIHGGDSKPKESTKGKKGRISRLAVEQT